MPTASAEPLASGIRIALLCGLLVGLGLGCRGETTSERGRVLVVGLDGATLVLAEPLMDAGRLPNLDRLAREGAYGVLRSHAPLQSPRIWTSIATGKVPHKHGILGFTRKEPDGRKRLVAGSDRHGWALWNMLSARALSVAVVNWWATYPPEVVNGVMVSDHFLPSVVSGRMNLLEADHAGGAPVVYPAAWSDDIAGRVAQRTRAPALLPRFAQADLPEWVRTDKLSEWLMDDRVVGGIALDIEARLRPDLMMVLLKGIDAASHVLFATTQPDSELSTPLLISDAQRSAGAEALYTFYAEADAVLGQLLARYGPNDLVLVVSDHGFEARRQYTALTGQHKGELAHLGIIFARGRGIEPGTLAEGTDIFDITPTILAWLGLPIGEDMDGRRAPFVEAEAVATIPSWDQGGITRVAGERAGSEAVIMEHLEALGYFENEEEE